MSLNKIKQQDATSEQQKKQIQRPIMRIFLVYDESRLTGIWNNWNLANSSKRILKMIKNSFWALRSAKNV